MKVGDEVKVRALGKKDAFWSKRKEFIGQAGVITKIDSLTGSWLTGEIKWKTPLMISRCGMMQETYFFAVELAYDRAKKPLSPRVKKQRPTGSLWRVAPLCKPKAGRRRKSNE